MSEIPLILCCKGQFRAVSESWMQSHSLTPFTVGPTLHGWRGHEPDQRLRVKEATKQEPKKRLYPSPQFQSVHSDDPPARDSGSREVGLFLLNEWSMQLPKPLCTEEGGNFISWSLPSWTSLNDFLLGLKLLFTTLAGFLGLRRAGLSLFRQRLLASLVCPQLVGMFHENLLVFEHITLHLQVQAVIHVAVNLLRFMVLSEQSAQNSYPLHQGYLLGHSSIGSTLSLTMPCHPYLSNQTKVFSGIKPEWTVIGFQMISPSLISFWICWVGGSRHWQFCYLGSNHF